MRIKLRPSDILSTRDTRTQLPSLLKKFRSQKEAASPVIVGANRRPEAVLMPYEGFQAIVSYLDDIAIAGEVEKRQSEAGDVRLSEKEFLGQIGIDEDEFKELGGSST